MPKSFKPLLPGIVVVTLGVIYTVFWFVMADRIEDEIERWVVRQADHGTEVSYEALKVNGYPFRLVATFEAPQIIAQEHDSGFSWAGDELRIVAHAYNIHHIMIDLIGRQSVSWLDAPANRSRSPSYVTIDFDGEKLRGSLKLKSGRIENIDTDFRKVSADIFTDGAITLLPDGPSHVDIEVLEYHSRLVKTKVDGKRQINRDVRVLAKEISTHDAPLEDMAPKIEEILVAFSEEVGGTVALHTGDIGADLPPTPAHRVTLHDAHILWSPVSARLTGKLTRGKNGKKSGDFSGNIDLFLKGHEELVRQKAENGDLQPAAAVAVGALFGILEMVSKTNEEGELVIPLKVKEGDIYFGFLPLFSKEDYE